MTFTIAAFYRFVPIADAEALRTALFETFTELELCGTLLIAHEGVNGTLAGKAGAIEAMLVVLQNRAGLQSHEVKFSFAPEAPFKRLKIRVKPEIITFKQPAADPNTLAGTYVAPENWNALIADPEILVLDTRNSYETGIGSFRGALDPNIERFTDFADYVRTNLDPHKHPKVAMYCTGGIRCEKASAFMRAEGFAEVFHLKGGILKYLEEVPKDSSQWQGDCYVFDRRVAVGPDLETSGYGMCFCCGLPISVDGRKDAGFEDGVSCAQCHDQTSDSDKARFRARQQQMQTQIRKP